MESGSPLGVAPAIDPVLRAHVLAEAEQRLLGAADPVCIDRFVVRGRLGAGSLGVVFAAFDPVLQREVAIKLLHPTVAAVRDDLGDEARAMARLTAPNVVTVHEVGVAEGRVMMVMERVHGRTLREWIATDRSWREVVAVHAAAGEGLAAAHDAGLVHRDFKPDNVLVADDGRVLVTDFGLATGSRASGDRSGTPTYMAPEQHAGAAVGPAADQFAFCVALYEALYRRRPFAGDDAEALARDKAEGRIIAPPRQSTVPAWLRTAVLRGLDPEPAARWSSMRALLGALARDPDRDRLRRIGIIVIAVIAVIAAVGATLQVIVFWRWYGSGR